MDSKNEIVVVGSCMIDFVGYAPRLPKPGETLHGTKFATNFGGKGANQCVAAAKLGARTSFVGRVGDDIWGDKYIENFKSQNVNVDFLKKTAGFSSGIAQINVADTGENQIVIIAGANTQMSVQDIEDAKDRISNAAVVICQLETPPEVAIRTFELSTGVSILNGAPGMTNPDTKLYVLPSIFCVNETEASMFTGLPVNDLDEGRNAVGDLLKKGCNSVLLTLGSQGSLYASQSDNTPIHIPTIGVEAVDTTGAGDCFLGGLAYCIAYYENLTLEEQIQIASFVAADSVKRPGTQISYPGPEILEKYFNSEEWIE